MDSNVYVTKALRKDIPSDAIILTRQQALSMHWKTITDWRPRTDTWPFTYGIGALCSLNALTTMNIVNYYRRRLRLGNYGRITMVLPTAVLPCILSIAGHVTMVSQSILLQDECPLCIQTRAAFIQIGLGVIYPVVASPFAAFHYAYTYGTYDVPPFRREYFSELGRLWLNMTQRLRMRLPLAIIVNGLAASVLTYFEADSFYNIQRQIQTREEEFHEQIYGTKNSKNS